MNRPPKAVLIWSGASAVAFARSRDFEIVWVAETAANRRGAEEAIPEHLRAKWSWFEVADGPADEAFLAVLELIEDHHGPYAQANPWDDLTIVGLDEAIVRGALAADGEFSVATNGELHVLRL